jgi:tRNA(Leu) C34 or U34 (ribose-2'-O)-methylase TrmL
VDILVNAGAVAYGITLVVATFVRHPLTEAMRIDALFIPQANERTRPLNLLMGVAIAGYGAWSLLSR